MVNSGRLLSLPWSLEVLDFSRTSSSHFFLGAFPLVKIFYHFFWEQADYLELFCFTHSALTLKAGSSLRILGAVCVGVGFLSDNLHGLRISSKAGDWGICIPCMRNTDSTPNNSPGLLWWGLFYKIISLKYSLCGKFLCLCDSWHVKKLSSG